MALAVIAHHPTTRILRRRLRTGRRAVLDGAWEVVRRVPFPAGARARVRERLLWRRGVRSVAVSDLLLGGQNQESAADFSRTLGDPLWPSTRVADGPHVQLMSMARGRCLSDAQVLATGYAEMARAAVAGGGHFFGARTEADIVRAARAFLSTSGAPAPDRTRPLDVAPIHNSGCFQLVDGHHRAARAVLSGALTVPVRVRRRSVSTPVQDLLQQMSWIGGEPELYQPVDVPEVATWPTVRGCVDRLESMLELLQREGVSATSYLDVASCYGWFVQAMQSRGFRAEGVEQDPRAPRVGELLYGAPAGAVHTAEAVTFLRGAGHRWEVVSCFSLLHHFVLGRSEDTAADLLQALDGATGRVLFLDTGQEHEAWFSESLAGWSAARVAEVLRQGTSFDRVVDLGPDHDARGRWADNYGRHLFACIRD